MFWTLEMENLVGVSLLAEMCGFVEWANMNAAHTAVCDHFKETEQSRKDQSCG